MKKVAWRYQEASPLFVAILIGVIGFFSVSLAENVRKGTDPGPEIAVSLIPVFIVGILFVVVHIILSTKKVTLEPFVLPITVLILMLGMIMIWRLRGSEGVYQQISRGVIPGCGLIIAMLVWPRLLEFIRRWAVYIGIGGLFLLFLTGVFGVQDESGARLALKLGPFPSIQTSEIIKLSLIIFLAWYIELEGEAVEGRAHSLLWFRLPALRYLAPAAAFVGAATLTLVAMSDYGAVLILGALFIVMLYTGFETRTFLSISALGLGLALVVGLVLSQVWTIPTSIQYRFLAFQNPWSSQIMGNGYTISEGPGYQIQQALYAVIAGGVSGSGLGMGSPYFIPLAFSDFILAAIFEEMGSAVAIAILFLYAFLVLRIVRIAILLPRSQVFERLLLTGISVHFFTQVFVMAGGTLNFIPLTGVTLPFLSLGGVAMMVNLFEIGIVLALVYRMQNNIIQDRAVQ